MQTRAAFFTFIFAAMCRGLQSASPVPSVPDRVQALVGSCVVIPCSFPAAAPHPRTQRVDVRLRYRGGGRFFPLQSTAFNSQDKDQVSRDFLGRTSLFGKMGEGDCSVRIDRIRQDDPQMIEVALKRRDDLLWGRPKSVQMDIIDEPEPPAISGRLSATEGQLVTLNCSLRYHCPSRPPTLQWKWERGPPLESTELWDAQTTYPDVDGPTLLASLSFTASHHVKPRLKCEVSYPGAKMVSTTTDLHVTFPPKEVRIQVQTLVVLEGGTALLMCSCKADPPVSEYRWSYSQHGRTVRLRHRTHTVRLFNVTRDMRVTCSAHNSIGRGESKPTALNIQYKPVIHRLSSNCSVEDSELVCCCLVDSNPKPAVTWSINGSVPPHGFNVSASSESSMLTASLMGRMERPLQVVCFALNALGNDSLVLLKGEEEAAPLLWLVLPAAVVCLLVSLLSLLIYCHRRKAQKKILSRPRVFHPEDLGIYQERTPLYINCTEVTHVYTNGSYQLVYQNCTPVFVRNNQIRPMARRGGERRRGEGVGHSEVRVGVRETRQVQDTSADPETAIYVEIL
ncbi:B-cell receptor CD22 isoform X2 [Oryzias melastigma]|uniref:Ig-like domain-containing protein n=1 Tax=Oryzias melastigma TaxID=30732 RepID=A0A3B3CMU9_ORYME|nr:B-cell receptor CD22 isoform X2 [Oryzias melastigma]